MKVLIFGGTGWVGHHIARVFHSAGDDVTICSRGRKSTYLDDIPDGIRRVRADKESETDVRGLFEQPCDVVVDSVPTEKSIDNVFRHAPPLERYIHCSSTGGYAPLPAVPGDETMPFDHFLGGWKRKSTVDAKVLGLFRREGFPATVLRPTYITGPGLRPLDNLGGRREDFIGDILAEKTLEIPNGGDALLQPTHVRGLAEAFRLAAVADGSVGQVYNVALAKAVTIRRYIEITAEALEREVRIDLVPLEEMLARHPEADEIGLRFLAEHMCYDISKVRRELGYEPPMTTEEAIKETARWTAGLTSPPI